MPTQAPMIDPDKARRENLRWYILLTLNSARPLGASEAVILSTIQGIIPDCTMLDQAPGYSKNDRLFPTQYEVGKRTVLVDAEPHPCACGGMVTAKAWANRQRECYRCRHHKRKHVYKRRAA